MHLACVILLQWHHCYSEHWMEQTNFFSIMFTFRNLFRTYPATFWIFIVLFASTLSTVFLYFVVENASEMKKKKNYSQATALDRWQNILGKYGTTKPVNSAFRALWLASQTLDILCYSPLEQRKMACLIVYVSKVELSRNEVAVPHCLIMEMIKIRRGEGLSSYPNSFKVHFLPRSYVQQPR